MGLQVYDITLQELRHKTNELFESTANSNVQKHVLYSVQCTGAYYFNK
jgi:hypothetical protein